MNVRLLLCGLLLMLLVSLPVSAQTYFQDDFDDPEVSETKWVPLYGQWEFNGGEYHQLQNAVNCMSVVADDFWDEAWNDYTFVVRGNKIGGAEGFLIMFRCMGTMQDRGVALNDHPPRMEGLEQLQYWWNLGGWGNSRSQVEAWGGGKAGANSNHTIDTDSWYEIKIVNTSTGYTLFLDDEEVATMDDAAQDGRGRLGLATWSTTARFDDVIVYGPDGPSAVVSSLSRLAISWASLKQ